MFTSFEQLLANAKEQSKSINTVSSLVKNRASVMGRELAADIVAELKRGNHSEEARKFMNKERIKALGLTLIQGGKA